MQQYGDHANANINILEWISRPRSFSKGQNLPYHIKAVKRFLSNIKAPEEFHQAILINLLDEDCQLEVFAHPEYQEENNSFQDTCELLLKVFDTRKSGFSKLVRLLEIQQESHESLSQYLARLRVEAYKMFGDEDKEQNEKYITSAFLNGLKNKSISKAIQTLEPETSEVAMKMARKAEDQCRHETPADCCEMSYGNGGQRQHTNNQKRPEKDELEEMRRQIQCLTEQVTYLSSKLRFQSNQNLMPQYRTHTYAAAVKSGGQVQTNRLSTDNFRTRIRGDSRIRPSPDSRRNLRGSFYQDQRAPVRCWNCEGAHVLRDCTKKILCKTCNRVGHVSRFCDSANAIRYIHEEPSAEGATEDCERTSVVSWEATEQEDFSENGAPAIMTVQDEEVISTIKRNERGRETIKQKRSASEDPEIQAWVRYINGETDKKPTHKVSNVDIHRKPRREWRRKSTPTVISNSRPEGAANKPLVMGKCGHTFTPILIDSGAALNVIDENFVRNLPVDSIIRRDAKESRIRCANDEIVRSKGRVTIEVTIGSRSENMVFSMMPSLFPRVIIGLRQMKHSKIVIDPPEDSLWVEGERVQFISETESLSTVNM